MYVGNYEIAPNQKYFRCINLSCCIGVKTTCYQVVDEGDICIMEEMNVNTNMESK